MRLANFGKRYIKLILFITLLVVLAWTVTGCEELGFPSPTAPAETTEETAEVVAPPTTVTTEDRATLAVYGHLLSQAKSYQAKVYLADFYTTCDKWSAKAELLRDGTSVWYVVVDMTHIKIWREKPHWQQAGWFVFQDGKVMSTSRLEANALRIEADLQELSLLAEAETQPEDIAR